MQDAAITLQTEVFPHSAHKIETVEYFARGLKDSSADHKPSKRGCQQCKTKVRGKGGAGKRGSNELDDRGPTMNEGKNHKKGGPRGQD